ncbi:GlcG/HbpS family heme-binding protein [Aestuariivirga litoralis]|uniref:GlcG/HbpS family heme-binding protein n=1 Tax=Aestuariivirga litoralis TaxID=2650924 RepID=UPI0018C851FD|nr:heme-binding protein [Aestuariivirga litoralis]MBG1233801.1 heme-binding protein [Aestuariivirga litoralis]
MSLTLEAAQAIIAKTFEHRKSANMKPLGAVIMDMRGVVKAAALEDGSSLARFDIASAKARTCVMFNIGTRGVEKYAKDRPHFMQGAMSAISGGLLPIPGGVIIKDKAGLIIGSIGVSGDTSDNDEIAALAGIVAAGFVGDAG